MSFDLKVLHGYYGAGQVIPPAEPHLASQTPEGSIYKKTLRFGMASPVTPLAVPQNASRWRHHCFQFHPSAPPSFILSCYSTSQDSIFYFNNHSLSFYYMPGTVYF